MVGVETPLQHEYRQAFKERVISKARAKRIGYKEFVLQAKNRKKLLESTPIPFNDQSWQISIQRYIELQPLVDVISLVVREYYDKGAYDVHMNFPN